MNCGPAPAVGASCDASPHSKAKEREESSVLRPALEWLQELLSIDIASTPSLFADCWLLGRMADVLRAAWAGTVPAHRPRPQAQMPRRRADVINDFVRWQAICTELGVGRDQLPPLADVEQGRGVAAICCCIWAAADRAAALGLPVPRFGSADARSSLRCSMTREAGAKRAEHFLSAGDSPPKLPSLPLLTPRAFLGRAASPTAAGPIANLRDSTGSLKGWLCEDSSLKSDWRLVDQQGGANGGLRPCTTAKGGAAVDAVGRTSSPPTSGAGTGTAPGTATGAAAATSRTATNASQQRWSRPLLPRLDVKAAAAAAAAEAAEQEEEEEAAAAEAAAAAAAANSPLSSPGSSTEVSPMAPYSGSSCVTSSCSASSPDCHRLTPNTLRTAAQGNPLWGASPGSRAPSPAAAAAAGTQIVLRQPRFDEAGDTGAASNSMVSPPPPQTRQLLRWEDEEEGGADADEGYGGGLLDSILSPPHLKPAHSQLLGALMHTSGDSASRAAAAAAAAAQARQRARQLELGWRVVSDELEASPVDGAAADGGAVLRLEHPEQEEEEEEEARVAQPAAAVVELAGEAAEQPGVETLCSVEAAPAGEGTEPSSNSSSSGLRRAALLLLGAVAGAAMAVAAGAVQQGKPMRRSFCRPQPVPSLAGRRLLPSEQQRALREARPGPGGGAAAALPGDRMDTITRG